MNNALNAADVVDVIRDFYMSNDGDEAATDLVKAIGARILGVNSHDIEFMISENWWGCKCPDCGYPVRCECVINGYEFTARQTEKIYSCRNCGAAWSTINVDGAESKPQRYFVG